MVYINKLKKFYWKKREKSRVRENCRADNNSEMSVKVVFKKLKYKKQKKNSNNKSITEINH